MTNIPDWMTDAVADGVQRLYALHLDGSPPAETIAGCTTAWIEAFAFAPIAWDEKLDRSRITFAFMAAASTLDRWPSPSAVRSLMPGRAMPPALPEPVGHGPSPEVKQRIKSLLGRLGAAR